MYGLIDMFVEWTMLIVSFLVAVFTTVLALAVIVFAIHILSGGDIPKNTTKCNCSSQSAEITAETNP